MPAIFLLVSRLRHHALRGRLRLLVALALAFLALSPRPTHAQTPAPLSWLRTGGPRIVNEKGETVVLAGVNLGGWLVEEMWMMPFETKPPPGSAFPEIKDHVSLWSVAEKRFGAERMRQVRASLRNAWLSEADFRKIRAAGMNCVRLPFTYDLLTGPDGFSWIDRAINYARANGLYVILDLHGAPGRQSADHHTGETGVNRLFKDPDMVRQTEEVWKRVATRYRDRPEVAGYDLLNEPMGAPDATTLHLVQDRLYRAIRAIDARHMVFIEEGYKGIETFPRPQMAGWENVVLSWHHYRFNAKSAQEQEAGLLQVASDARKIQSSRSAPVLIGEFQIEPYSSPAALATGLRALQETGASWTIWSYKSAMKVGGGGFWGWVHAPKPLDALNFFTDSPETLTRKAEQFRSENLTEQTAMTQVFRDASRITPLPPLQEVVPTAKAAPVTWRYTTEKPSDNWFAPTFDDSGWKPGQAGFGADWKFEGQARTEWKTGAIYLRREFTVPAGGWKALRLLACHDDDADVYINGVLAAKLGGYNHAYQEETITPEALATIKPGRNVLAVHCRQGAGEQYIDVGLLGLPNTPAP